MPRPGVGKTRRRSRRSLPGTVRVDWRRRKNSEHEITKKTNGLSYRLYALRFFPSRRFYKPEAVHLPQIRLNPRDLRLNFSVVAALRWVSRYFSRQGAKEQSGKTLPNDRILVSNLSVLAPLRETSATQAADIRRISTMRWTISPSYAK